MVARSKRTLPYGLTDDDSARSRRAKGSRRDHAYVAETSAGEVILGVDNHEAQRKIRETKKWFARWVRSK